MTGELSLGIDHLADVELLGSGGFSVVYSATHTLFDRRVAVKVLTNVISDSDRRRFERECRVMGRLSGNPNVVTVFHADYTSQGKPYLIMELVEGGTLNDRLVTSGPLPWQEAVDLVIPICAALVHAHREGILHRDIKPENLLLDDGVPKLTDFGIAHLRDGTGKSSTQVSASWLHTPPETFENERDERSDLYSLASTLYTLIVGHAPFWREGEESLYPLMNRLLNDPVPDLPDHLAPPELRSFLARALAKDPAQRPQTAQEFAANLAEIRGVATPPGAETRYAPDFEPTAQVGGLLAAGVATGQPASARTAGSPGGGHQLPPTGDRDGLGYDVTSPLTIDPDADPRSITGGLSGAGPTQWPPADAVVYARPERPPPRRSRAGLIIGLLLLLVLAGAGVATWMAVMADNTAAPGDGGSESPELPVVPNVVGMTEQDAVEVLDGLGIEVTEVLEVASATADEGEVVSQNPNEGAEADSVVLTVSTGAGDAGELPVVPNVVGMTEEEAATLLEGAGITAAVAERIPSETLEEGIVISQDPEEGAEADAVELTVSTGPAEDEVPTVPDVRNMPEAQAVNLLEGLGISVTIGSRTSSATIAEGRVISQVPGPDAQATEVTLTISTGGALTFTGVTLSPPSPHVFEVGEQVSISIAYTSTRSGNVQIWARPTSGDYTASGSAELGPGSGNHPQSFRLNSPGTVNRIRVFAVDAGTNDVIAERFLDVNYTWEAAPEPPATPTQQSPANGTVFNHFPRTTTLQWSSVPGAASYSVEVQFQSGATWSSGNVVSDIAGTSHTFDFVGAQPGRWRVWAVGPDGLESPKSSWWTFEYTV